MLSEKNLIQKHILPLQGIALSVPLAVYAYMGLFSRYIADDYCHSALVQNNTLSAAIQQHYLAFSNRYMILIVPFITDLFGVRGQSYLPGTMIVLWVLALYWLFSEVSLATKFNWSKIFRFVLAAMLAFFTILQAPNHYQSIYWEASSINRFVPLVLTTFLLTSTFYVIRKYGAQGKNLGWAALYFVLTFLIGGFDEMNDVLIFAIAFLALIGTFIWAPKGQKRTFQFWLFGSIFAASLVSMAVMSQSPGIAWRVGEAPRFMVFLGRIFTYPIDFIVDTFRTMPVPTAVLSAGTFAIFALINEKMAFSKRTLALLIIAAPVLLYGILLVNFAPSAYAQAYPAERALLGAQAVMTLALMAVSAFAAQFVSNTFKNQRAEFLLVSFLIVFSLYPLRAAWQTFNGLDHYRERATAWDERDAYIRAEAARGVQDIIVTEFDSLHGIKELDEKPNHWVNRCAAEYYGVETITAVLPENE